MKSNSMPNVDEVEYINYYKLVEFGFEFNEPESSLNNLAAINRIIDDFSSRYNIAPQVVKGAFDREFLSIRSTEDIMILYNNKGNDDVYRHYTNIDSITFRLFFRKS